MTLGLERIKVALLETKKCYKDIPAIQIAGTNGKGSITCFLESCLTEAGIKTGCTTSPHLESWCERIRINCQEIQSEEFEARLNKLKPIIKRNNLTSFEIIILTALDHFYSNKVDLIILEVGLGGRLDATTAYPYRPLIGFGGIGLDHCEHLGKDLSSIAKEKAAVISNGSNIFSCSQDNEVRNIIERVASNKNAKVHWLKPLSKQWQLGIPGEIQRENAAVAKGILESLSGLGWNINNKAIKKGLANAQWPGRLQNISWKNIPLILDGAHNVHGAKALAKERLLWKNQEKGIYWIIGIQAHKQAPEIINTLLGNNDIVSIVPVPGSASWKVQEIEEIFPKISKRIFPANSISEILESLLLKGNYKEKLPIVITGSLYLIGNFLSNEIYSQ
ncbi:MULTISPECIES: bifunctional folylpolyglutamate synthase/dihydrofolate synthase [Prochlorococcus]|uniref:bifunctional folylpolyglutamate synthase/dihydrofolate synthase n=1 Tax=Prochlorococcus TaxID=1218 RepID=UPI000907B4D7|nr:MULTISPECIES: Mur ligase family protein [Prochlorococcus]